MATHPYVAVTPMPIVSRHISAELPRTEVIEHEEWLLDEALAETFSADDPVAVTVYSYRPTHRVLASKVDVPELSQARKLMTAAISECAIGNDEAAGLKSLTIPLHCDLCHTEIPATVAFNFEGVDYVYHFCGAQCLADWCKAINTHEK